MDASMSVSPFNNALRNDSDFCTCKGQGTGVVIWCNGPSCPYHNQFHATCLGFSDLDIQNALATPNYLCPACKAHAVPVRMAPPAVRKQRRHKEESDGEFDFKKNEMGDMPSDDDEYQVASSSEDDEMEEDDLPSRKLRSSDKKHPWSEDEDDEKSAASSRAHRNIASNNSEAEGTRKSTRIRRSAFSGQNIIMQDELSSDSEDVATTYTHTSHVLSCDAPSQVERILGRRVLANTKEAATIAYRNRMAIGIHKDNEENKPEDIIEGDLDNAAFEYLVKWRNQSFSRLTWESYDMLVNDYPPHGKSRLYRFVKMLPRDEYGNIIEYPPTTPAEQYFNPNYLEIERVVSCSTDMDLNLDGKWQKGCREIVDLLLNFTRNDYYYIDPFLNPVDEEKDGAPGYYSVITKPMWMNKIIAKLDATEKKMRGEMEQEGDEIAYENELEFYDDLELIFSNCRKFNMDPSCDIVVMCNTLEDLYHQKRDELDEELNDIRELRYLIKPEEGKTKYLVKWYDLSYKDCTWEDPEVITDKEMITAYEQRRKIPSYKLVPPKTKAERVVKGESAILRFKDNKTLRTYQWEGFRWLRNNYNEGKNSILADEMGLGKTVQCISLMEYIIHGMETQQPILVIAPLSTLGFWRREIENWTTLNVVMYHDNEGGKEIRKLIEKYEWYYNKAQLPQEHNYPIYKFDVLLTTYEIAIADVEEIRNVRWSLVVVDEAQRMKNKSGRLQQTLHTMKYQQCLLLTGTPLQNNMTELWTLLNFVAPQTFPSSAEFLQQYGNLSNKEQVRNLQALLKEYVLRRLKEEVEDSIPPKEETIIDVELTTQQKTYYRAIYDHNRDFFVHGYIHTGMGVQKVNNVNKGPRLVNMEMQFRKCCNHPYMLDGVEEIEAAAMQEAKTKEWNTENLIDHPFIRSSGKMVLLHKLLTKLKAEGHRVLIFSQFTMMLDLLERYLRLANYDFTRIDGSIRGNAREDAIKRFNDPESNIFCFLLSTRAGGVGITLTSADTVIIFDSDWNPQNDVQAQARCHRIGQTKAVRVYRLITRDTYESAMFERASRKLGLEQAVMSNGRKNVPADMVEILLKEGAYSALLEDKEGEERSKVFCESNIDDLLEKRSRVITYDKESTSLFSKTSFISSQADSKLDINDPLFWKKVFGEDSRETIFDRLEDGRATKTEEAKQKFLQELKEMSDEVIEQKLSGENVPAWYPILHNTLKQVATMAEFTKEEQDQALHLANEIERPSRKRRQVNNIITEDEYSLTDPDFTTARKGEFADEVCCKCFKDFGLIRCSGPCHRCFHAECVESHNRGKRSFIDPPMRKQKDSWKCMDCINHRYTCWICGKAGYDAEFYDQLVEQGLIESADVGEDEKKKIKKIKKRKPKKYNDDDYEAYGSHAKVKKNFKQNPLVSNPDVVFKCLVKNCGRFYHIACIQNEDYGSKERFTDLSKFRCPVHFCSKCHVTGNTKHLVQCMMCSAASHVGCLDENSGHRMSKIYYICSKHECPRGVPTWDPKKKMMITDDSYGGKKRSGSAKRVKAEKQVYEPIEYTVPLDQYKGNWCRYCGARRSSGFMKGPWGPKTLCVVHYVSWFRTKKLDLSAYPEIPTEPINIEANSEPKYIHFLRTKKEREPAE